MVDLASCISWTPSSSCFSWDWMGCFLGASGGKSLFGFKLYWRRAHWIVYCNARSKLSLTCCCTICQKLDVKRRRQILINLFLKLYFSKTTSSDVQTAPNLRSGILNTSLTPRKPCRYKVRILSCFWSLGTSILSSPIVQSVLPILDDVCKMPFALSDFSMRFNF